MAKIIKRNIDSIIAVGIGLCLVIVAMVGIYQRMPMAPVNYVSAATDTDITVSATVQEWITLGVSTSSVGLTPNLVDTAGNTAIGTSTAINITVGTNNGGGWHLDLSSLNGALATSTYNISTCDVTSTIAAGTDMYGVNATTSYAGVDIKGYYDYWGQNIVGTASTTAQELAHKTDSNASTTVATMKIMAACDADQEAGTYTDTLTITATGGA